jgi:hypothetical protein
MAEAGSQAAEGPTGATERQASFLRAASEADAAGSKWLLAAAAGLVTATVASIQLARPAEPGWLLWGGVALVALAVLLIVPFAVAVQRIQYWHLGQLVDAMRQPGDLKAIGAKRVDARWGWLIERSVQSEVPTIANQEATGIEDLYAKLWDRREIHDDKRRRLEQYADSILALANRVVQQQRLRRLVWLTILGASLFLAGSVMLSLSTQSHSEGLLVSETVPVVVHLHGEADWSKDLSAECGQGRLYGFAVGGNWPTPLVVIPPRGDCAGGVIHSESGGYIVVPRFGSP